MFFVKNGSNSDRDCNDAAMRKALFTPQEYENKAMLMYALLDACQKILCDFNASDASTDSLKFTILSMFHFRLV